jgi:hypothetical protein
MWYNTDQTLPENGHHVLIRSGDKCHEAVFDGAAHRFVFCHRRGMINAVNVQWTHHVPRLIRFLFEVN